MYVRTYIFFILSFTQKYDLELLRYTSQTIKASHDLCTACPTLYAHVCFCPCVCSQTMSGFADMDSYYDMVDSIEELKMDEIMKVSECFLEIRMVSHV